MGGKHRDAASRMTLFVERFLADGCKSPTDSFIAAFKWKGDRNNASKHASRYLRNARAQGLIEKRVNKIAKAMGADEVIERLSAIARGDLKDYTSTDQNGTRRVDLDAETAKDKTWLLSEMTIEEGCDKDGMPWTKAKIKKADTLTALQALARIHNLEKKDAPAVNVLTVGAALNELPGGTVRDLARKMLAAGRDEIVDAEVTKE